MVIADQREKNREKQRKYREKLKNSNACRLTLIVEKETSNRLRDIALKSKITQGEVIDRILKGGDGMNTATAEAASAEADVVTTTVDRFRYEDFALSERAIHIISMMLGFNLKDTMTEEARNEPDAAKIKALETEQDQLLNEQKLIYRGNKKIMKGCIEKYSPIIQARFE